MNWIELKALNDIYLHGEVRLNHTLSASPTIGYLAGSLRVLQPSTKCIVSLEGFQELYRQKYLEKYTRYFNFLENHQFLKPQSRFEEEDIQTLMNIQLWTDTGDLIELRNQIIASDESLRGISQMFFKNEKYLDNRPALVDALKAILNVKNFSNEKDQQYIYKLECLRPSMIVLCENLHFLTKPTKPRERGIELWYAGGKNVAKLSYADNRGLPIFYSCDWDYDGLYIIYPLVKSKIPSIRLLTPTGKHRNIDDSEHHSLWKILTHQLNISQSQGFFSSIQVELIRTLVLKNEWIIEESNDLIRMIDEGENCI